MDLIVKVTLEDRPVPRRGTAGVFEWLLVKDEAVRRIMTTGAPSVRFEKCGPGSYVAMARRLLTDGTEFSPYTPPSAPFVIPETAGAPATIEISVEPEQ